MSWVITGKGVNAPLLDAYSGAAAAFSLRQLQSGSYPVVRVRRSSDSTESDFTAAQVSDGTLAAFVGAGNNGFVRTWYDQSGNGRNATQTTAASQPRIVDSGVLESDISKPCVNFTVGLGLEIVNRPLTGATSPSVFALAKYTWGAEFASMLFTQSSGAATLAQYEIRRFPLANGNSYNIVTGAATGMEGTTSIVNQTAILSVVASSGTSTGVYINGSLDLTQASSISPIQSQPAFIGSRNGSFLFKGKIHELIIYPAEQSATRSGIESNINTYYAIY